MRFDEMDLKKPLLDAVHESGYTVPTPIQEATVPTALTGRDLLGCAQTGTGKTAAFALPILQRLMPREGVEQSKKYRPIRSLILAPTRELAIQNFDTFVALGKHVPLTAAVIYGGVGQDKQVKALKTGIDILVATPGRLLDLIRQGFVHLEKLEIFVLDEADRMLDMGFIHDVKAIIALLPAKKQTLFFSATMPDEVEALAKGLLRSPATVKVNPVTSTVDKIKQCVYFVDRNNKKDLLLNLLNEKGVSTALVFTRTKSDADRVSRILCQNKIEAMAIHGNKSQGARQKALAYFKSGKIAVLAATDIAARGIDIAELPFVINYNIPEESETYIHRIGRTGRAGLGGSAISFCSPEELNDFRAIEKLIKLHVPVENCEWSIKDIQPAQKPKKQPFVRAKKPAAEGEGFSYSRLPKKKKYRSR